MILLHEGLTRVCSQKKPRLHFVDGFSLNKEVWEILTVKRVVSRGDDPKSNKVVSVTSTNYDRTAKVQFAWRWYAETAFLFWGLVTHAVIVLWETLAINPFSHLA